MKPILFNTEMVCAILNDTKTVTRRVVKGLFAPSGKPPSQPYCPGDILYVRETWEKLVGSYVYKANQKPNMRNPGKWRPSIHMPREAARIFLRVTDVRVERLQEMTIEDCVRDFGFCREAIRAVGRDALAKPFWDSTIKPADRALYGWEANPWCWVIEFERINREEAL